ncbi:MAG TPA: DUF4129 domain-containing protein [Thermomicrobiaceae bacterium]|nr:DUF4129 domain-containing protein [Thermomicrobiaceae bacterium]
MATWLRSDWPDLVISVLVAAVEAAVLAPWLHLIAGFVGHPGAAVPWPVGIAVVGLASFWMARGLLLGGWDVTAARAASVGLWLVLVVVWYGLAGAGIAAPLRVVDGLFSLRGSLLAILAVSALAWWRGLALGSEPESFNGDFVRGLVLRGVVVLGLGLVLAAIAGGPAGRAALDAGAVALPVVLIGGLVAAAGVQVRLSRRRVRTAGDRSGLGWLGASAGIALGIVLVALLVAGVAGRSVWAEVAGPLGALVGLVGAGIYWLLIAIAYLFFLLATPLLWLAHRAIGSNQPAQKIQQAAPPPLSKFQQQAHQGLSPTLIHLLQVGLFVVVAAVVVWLVLRSLRRFRQQVEERPVDEVRESVWSSDLALAQLRGWLRGLGPHRGGRRRASVDLNAAPASVRDAYRHLLVLAERRERARRAAESPVDYAARLEAAWPAVDDPLDDLTARYLAARYGEVESAEDVARARDDWAAIRARLASDARAG